MGRVRPNAGPYLKRDLLDWLTERGDEVASVFNTALVTKQGRVLSFDLTDEALHGGPEEYQFREIQTHCMK